MGTEKDMDFVCIMRRFVMREYPDTHIIVFIPNNQAERILMRSLIWLGLWSESGSISKSSTFYLKTKEARYIWEQINSEEEEC